MSYSQKRRSGILVLLLFLTVQIILPAFCCCGLSTLLAQDTTALGAGELCTHCADEADEDLGVYQLVNSDSDHECPCKARMAKQLITRTNATIQVNLPLHLDAVIHTVHTLDRVHNNPAHAIGLAGIPLKTESKHSHSYQSLVCRWLC